MPSWAHFSPVRMDAGDPERSDMRIRSQVRDLTGPRGLPLFKPPYSQLTAFDMNAGEKLWSVPVGDGPRDHEALRDLKLPRLGSFQKLGGPLLTKTLLFIGQGKETHRIGAYDKETGEELRGAVPCCPHLHFRARRRRGGERSRGGLVRRQGSRGQ